jgi:site-specific recombinase XerD
MTNLNNLESEVQRLRCEQANIFHSLISENTRSSYRYDWLMFEAWCAGMELTPLPATPETVSLYIVALLSERKKVVTVRRRCCAIAWYHRKAALTSPIDQSVRDLVTGAQRQRKEKPRQMRPLSIAQIREISIGLAQKKTDVAIRNRALMLVGFASALRRYGGHSLRSGFITAAGELGAGELLIASQSGHKNMQVLRRYFRRSELFRANAGAVLDL